MFAVESHFGKGGNMGTRRLSKVVTTVGVLALIFASCGGSSSSSSDSGASKVTSASGDTNPVDDVADNDLNGTMTVALDAEPGSLDPAGDSLSLANGSVYDGIFETLMQGDYVKAPTPWLAKTVTESADRLYWTLVLQEGVVFHDGTPFDAAAVKFNLERQRVSPYNGSGLTNITAVDIVDPMSVKITLAVAWTAFPNVLTGINGVMVSPASAADPEKVKRNPVGTGPYKFVEWIPSDRISLARNDAYWGENKAQLATLTYKFITDETARLTALIAGDLDAMTTIVDASVQEADSKGFQTSVPPVSGYGLIHLNNKKPGLDDDRVRRALEMSIDREALADAFDYFGYDTESGTPISMTSRWYSAPATPNKFDPEGAKALLADYGKPVKFTIELLQGSQSTVDALAAIVEYWKQVGIEAKVKMVPDLATYVVSVITGAYEAVAWLAGEGSDPDGSLFAILHTGGPSNYSLYSNPEMDAALDEGRSAPDEATRMAAYAKAQDLFRSQVPFLVLTHGQMRILATKNVTGLTQAAFFPSRTAGIKAK